MTPAASKGKRWASIDAVRTEEFVVDEMLKHYDNAVLPDVQADGAGESVDDIEAELKAIADMRGRGEISFAEWEAMRKPMQERLVVAKSRVPRKRSVELTEPGVLRDVWPRLDLAGKREILHETVASVNVLPAGGKGRWARPKDRVVVTFKDE